MSIFINVHTSSISKLVDHYINTIKKSLGKQYNTLDVSKLWLLPSIDSELKQFYTVEENNYV